jgi:3-hydroxyacyl-CoA dehydrogenase
VVVGVCFGFVGNRMMLEGYVREADQMLLEGATPEQVDRAIYNFGFAMGPFAMNDMAGLDVSYRIRQTSNAAACYPEPYHTVMDAIAAEGHYGQKTGRGMYRYEPGDRRPHNCPETLAVIEREANRLNIGRRHLEDDEIAERCVLALINEGAKILEEGIACRAGDIDVIWVNGYGFPRHLGGPMFHADTLGLDRVLARIRELHTEFGGYWEPAPLLEKLAASGQSFYNFQ